MSNHEKDLEKSGEYNPTSTSPVEYGDAVPGEALVAGSGIRAKLMHFAGKLGVEQRGIERVPEDERHDTSILNIGTMVSYSTIEN